MKTKLFLLKSRFLDHKWLKNPKNNKNPAKIDNEMNFSFSLRLNFFARISFIAINSLLVFSTNYIQTTFRILKNWVPLYSIAIYFSKSAGILYPCHHYLLAPFCQNRKKIPKATIPFLQYSFKTILWAIAD